MSAAAQPVGSAEGERVKERHSAVDDDVDGSAADFQKIADQSGIALIIRAGHDMLESFLLGDVAFILDLFTGLDVPGTGGVDIICRLEAYRAVNGNDLAALVRGAGCGSGAGDADADNDNIGFLFFGGFRGGIVKCGKFDFRFRGLLCLFGKSRRGDPGEAEGGGCGNTALQEGTTADFFHGLTLLFQFCLKPCPASVSEPIINPTVSGESSVNCKFFHTSISIQR